jgi:hypothetical protein
MLLLVAFSSFGMDSNPTGESIEKPLTKEDQDKIEVCLKFLEQDAEDFKNYKENLAKIKKEKEIQESVRKEEVKKFQEIIKKKEDQSKKSGKPAKFAFFNGTQLKELTPINIEQQKRVQMEPEEKRVQIELKDEPEEYYTQQKRFKKLQEDDKIYFEKNLNSLHIDLFIKPIHHPEIKEFFELLFKNNNNDEKIFKIIDSLNKKCFCHSLSNFLYIVIKKCADEDKEKQDSELMLAFPNNKDFEHLKQLSEEEKENFFIKYNSYYNNYCREISETNNFIKTTNSILNVLFNFIIAKDNLIIKNFILEIEPLKNYTASLLEEYLSPIIVENKKDYESKFRQLENDGTNTKNDQIKREKNRFNNLIELSTQLQNHVRVDIFK